MDNKFKVGEDVSVQLFMTITEIKRKPWGLAYTLENEKSIVLSAPESALCELPQPPYDPNDPDHERSNRPFKPLE